MPPLNMIFLVVALLLFALGGVGIPFPSLNWIAWGLFFWVLATLLGGR